MPRDVVAIVLLGIPIQPTRMVVDQGHAVAVRYLLRQPSQPIGGTCRFALEARLELKNPGSLKTRLQQHVYVFASAIGWDIPLQSREKNQVGKLLTGRLDLREVVRRGGRCPEIALGGNCSRGA